MVYWEDAGGFLFDAGWGVSPPVLYVPSAAVWLETMPGWLRERRDIVIDRLTENSGHTLVTDDLGYYRDSDYGRSLPAQS